MIMLVLKKCNGDWGSALPQFARNLAPTLTTTTATRLSVQTECRRCANPPWFNRSLGWWNWVPKCSGFFLGGGVQRFCWTQQIYRSNKFLDPICFWMQALFRPNMFFGSEQSFGSKKVLEPKHSRIFGSQHFNQGIFANLRHSVWALVVVVVSVVVVVVVSVVVVVVVVMWANGP